MLIVVMLRNKSGPGWKSWALLLTSETTKNLKTFRVIKAEIYRKVHTSVTVLDRTKDCGKKKELDCGDRENGCVKCKTTD